MKEAKGNEEAMKEALGLSEVHRLPEAHIGLIYHVANKWARKYNIPREELLGPAAEGILRALETWDPKKGSFGTYGMWWAEARVREQIRQILPQGISLDEPLVEEDGGEAFTLGEVLSSSLPYPEEEVEKRLLQEDVRARIAELPPLLRQYALLRMGMGGRRELSPQEVAAFLGMPPRRAERCEESLRKALSPLRDWL